MSRPLRIEYSDAWYHVMNRGRRGEDHVNKIQEAMKLQVFENDCPTAKPVHAGPAELALIQAANDGDTSLVHKLLEMGVEPHAVGVGGQNALFNAAQKGHLPIVNLLLEHGAKPDIKTIADGTPFFEPEKSYIGNKSG